jgi:hypothetical protein
MGALMTVLAQLVVLYFVILFIIIVYEFRNLCKFIFFEAYIEINAYKKEHRIKTKAIDYISLMLFVLFLPYCFTILRLGGR